MDYGRAHNILLPSEGNNVIMQKLTDLNQEMTKVEAEVLANQYQALKDTHARELSGEAEDERDEGARQPAVRARAEARDGDAAVRAEWPEVLTLNQELAEVRQQLANEKRKALEQAKVEYNLAVAHRERLAAALAARIVWPTS